MAWFDDGDLRRLAGAGSYERGLGYLDAVRTLDDVPGGGVVATVLGTEPYLVRLLDRDGALAGLCTCPFGREGAFCKHCVAAGLTLLAVDASLPATPRGAVRRGRNDLRSYLTGLDHADLVELLLDRARRDPVLLRRLLARSR